MLANRSGSILDLAGSTGKGYSAGRSVGSAGKLLWNTQRDTRRDPLAGCSGGILGGIHWRATLAGYRAGSDPLASCSGRSGEILGGIHWAGSTGQLLWRDTRPDPLASRSGGILGGIHWQAALAGYWVEAWCRTVANADSDIKSNNPFLSGGVKRSS